MEISDEDIKRVKGRGFLNNRGTDLFSARIITENTCLTAEQLEVIAQASRLYGNGNVSLTSRMTVEVMGIGYVQIEPLTAFLAAHGLAVGGTGNRVRPVTSCQGTVCNFGQLDTHALAKEIHERFYIGYRAVSLPHKFKIAVGGCPNNCIKPILNDVGLVGNAKPIFKSELCRNCKKCGSALICPVDAFELVAGKQQINEEKCIRCGQCAKKCAFKAVCGYETGIRVYIGGMGGKTLRQGTPLRGLYTPKVALELIEKTLLYFKENA